MHLKLSSRGKIVVYDHDPLTGLGLGEGSARHSRVLHSSLIFVAKLITSIRASTSNLVVASNPFNASSMDQR